LGAIRKDSADQFRIAFGELAKARRGDPVQVDPFLIGRAVALVMKECTVRSASGRPLLWNDYRVVLARRDFDMVRPLQASLDRDLRAVLVQEASARNAELVGELRVNVVFDEADELPAGEGVIRALFVPTEKLRVGEMTVRFDGRAISGEIDAKGDTVFVDESITGGYALRWPGGAAPLAIGRDVIVGRPHDGAPADFIALTGATSRVNKQQMRIAVGATSVRISRLPGANPVHVNRTPIAAGEELDVGAPAEISLSRGELVVTLEYHAPDSTILGVGKPRR
jgi:FhaA, N-terminal domain